MPGETPGSVSLYPSIGSGRRNASKGIHNKYTIQPIGSREYTYISSAKSVGTLWVQYPKDTHKEVISIVI